MEDRALVVAILLCFFVWIGAVALDHTGGGLVHWLLPPVVVLLVVYVYRSLR